MPWQLTVIHPMNWFLTLENSAMKRLLLPWHFHLPWSSPWSNHMSKWIISQKACSFTLKLTVIQPMNWFLALANSALNVLSQPATFTLYDPIIRELCHRKDAASSDPWTYCDPPVNWFLSLVNSAMKRLLLPWHFHLPWSQKACCCPKT